jgi:hypothetical protein
MSYRVIHTENKSAGELQSELNQAARDDYKVVPGAAGAAPIIVLERSKEAKAIRATLGETVPAFDWHEARVAEEYGELYPDKGPGI